jgi:hypothetical protein
MAATVVSDAEMNVEIAKCCWAIRNWQSNKKNVFGNAKTFFTLAGTFDSKFHSGENNQRQFKYRDKTLTGSDLNYYFQGLIWQAGGQLKAEFISLLTVRKLMQYRTAPSQNTLWAANLGYNEAPSKIRSFNAGTLR